MGKILPFETYLGLRSCETGSSMLFQYQDVVEERLSHDI